MNGDNSDNHWTDNIIGTADDRYVDTQKNESESAIFVTLEALAAQIVANFINSSHPEREHCWIAEMNGEIVGSVFVVQASTTDAKLRLLLVEPKARGLGLGTRLV